MLELVLAQHLAGRRSESASADGDQFTQARCLSSDTLRDWPVAFEPRCLTLHQALAGESAGLMTGELTLATLAGRVPVMTRLAGYESRRDE